MKLKHSTTLGFQSCLWTLMGFLFTGLFFYALTGDPVRSFIMVIVLILASSSYRKAQYFWTMSSQNKIVEIMRDLETQEKTKSK